MGREIRHVPLDWQHPKNEHGNYIPLFDQDYTSAATDWLINCIAWNDGTHSDLRDDPELKEKFPFYWDWESYPPTNEHYRPRWTKENPPIGYQIYENLSEGTPVSPVFKSEDEMKAWLVGEGHSDEVIDEFIKNRYTKSFVVSDGVIYANVD